MKYTRLNKTEAEKREESVGRWAEREFSQQMAKKHSSLRNANKKETRRNRRERFVDRNLNSAHTQHNVRMHFDRKYFPTTFFCIIVLFLRVSSFTLFHMSSFCSSNISGAFFCTVLPSSQQSFAIFTLLSCVFLCLSAARMPFVGVFYFVSSAVSAVLPTCFRTRVLLHFSLSVHRSRYVCCVF